MHSEMIFTTYYTGKRNPQRTAKPAIPNDFNMIKEWYESVIKYDLHAVIFHDCLMDSFVKEYENDNVQFIKVPYYSDRSLNDERFYVYRKHLIIKQNEIKWVLFTDLFDVVFNRDPFKFMESFQEEEFRNLIFVGSENYKTANFSVIKNNAKRAYGKDELWINLLDIKCINAGIIGGKTEIIMSLLNVMLHEFGKIDTAINSNMFVLSKALLGYGFQYFTGYPFHSEYRKEEKEGLFYIKHK